MTQIEKTFLVAYEESDYDHHVYIPLHIFDRGEDADKYKETLEKFDHQASRIKLAVDKAFDKSPHEGCETEERLWKKFFSDLDAELGSDQFSSETEEDDYQNIFPMKAGWMTGELVITKVRSL